MKKEEVLERLHYLDTRLDNELKEEPTLEGNFLRLINEIRKELDAMNIQQLRKREKEIDNDGEHWRVRREGKYCKKIKINPKLCCVDDYHGGMCGEIDEVAVSHGMPIHEVFKKRNAEMIKRIESAKKNLDLSLNLNPVVVRPFKEGGLFEVIAGNHRVMAAISLMKKSIPVLCFCGSGDKDVVEDFIISKKYIK